MPNWVALLKGVNVGGNNKVPMGKLRKACEAAGWDRVRSYIASGNLVFTADGSHEGLSGALQSIIKTEFGVSTLALVVDETAIRQALSARPVEPAEGKQLHGFFCFGTPVIDQDAYQSLRLPSEELTQSGGVIWLYTPEGFGRSKLAEKFGKVVRGTEVTGRNLNTIRALVEMLDDLG